MRKKIVWLVAISITIGLVMRIYHVNKNAIYPVYEYYNLREWINYNGSYLVDESENTKGYYARVLSASFMTYREYAEKYDIPIDTLIESYGDKLTRDQQEDIYNLGMVDVQIEFRNDFSNEGYISLSETKIFAENDNIYYRIAEPLLDLQEPQLASGIGYFFALKPNGETVSLNIPYILPVYSDGYIGQETDNYPKYLTITLFPTRKYVKILKD